MSHMAAPVLPPQSFLSNNMQPNNQISLYQKPGSSPVIPEKTTHSDSSGAIFSMYIGRAQKFDEENAENWKGGAEGILVFVCSTIQSG
ncbi:hypothetical protein BJV77DRAFT_1011658 [Russula vinacea]|nr:hypothetical protein BJV77DRAFT_1011658 [Russula vinacea]